MNTDVAQKELQDILMPEEKVDLAFKLVRDLLVFTEKRLIIVDSKCQEQVGHPLQVRSLCVNLLLIFLPLMQQYIILTRSLKIFNTSVYTLHLIYQPILHVYPLTF